MLHPEVKSNVSVTLGGPVQLAMKVCQHPKTNEIMNSFFSVRILKSLRSLECLSLSIWRKLSANNRNESNIFLMDSQY